MLEPARIEDILKSTAVSVHVSAEAPLAKLWKYILKLMCVYLKAAFDRAEKWIPHLKVVVRGQGSDNVELISS